MRVWRAAAAVVAVVAAAALGAPASYAGPVDTPRPVARTAGVGISVAVTPAVIVQGATSTILVDTNAPTGSRVVLQRRIGTQWRSLREKRLDGSHHMEFTLTPPSGLLRYRAWLPFQRVGSSPVKLRVKWQPTLTLGLAWAENASGDRVVTASGTTNYTGTGQVVLRLLTPAGTWVPLAAPTLNGGSFSATLPVSAGGNQLVPGTQVLAVLPATTERAEEQTAASVPSLDPLVVTLNDPLGLRQAELAQYAAVGVDATAGQEVTLRYAATGPIQAILAPDGSAVTPQASGASYVRFAATQTGRYLVTVGPGLTELYASTPKVVPIQLDHYVAEGPDLPGQVVELSFSGGAGDLVTLDLPEGPGRLIAPDGTTVTPWYDGPGTAYPVFRLPADGSYRLRFEDGTAVATVASVPIIDTGIDQAPVQVTVDHPQQLGLLRIATPAHEPFSLRPGRCAGRNPGNYLLVDAQGHLLADQWQVVTPTDDVYYVLVLAPGETTSWSVASPTELSLTVDGPPVAVSAPGSGCEWFRGSFSASAGDVVEPRGTPLPDGLAITGPAAPWGAAYWVLPATGTYVYDFTAPAAWSSELSLASWPARALPADGTPLTFGSQPSVDHHALRLTGTPGTTYQLDVSGAGLDAWELVVRDAGGSHATVAELSSTTSASATVTLGDQGAYLFWTGSSVDPVDVTVTATPL